MRYPALKHHITVVCTTRNDRFILTEYLSIWGVTTFSFAVVHTFGCHTRQWKNDTKSHTARPSAPERHESFLGKVGTQLTYYRAQLKWTKYSTSNTFTTRQEVNQIRSTCKSFMDRRGLRSHLHFLIASCHILGSMISMNFYFLPQSPWINNGFINDIFVKGATKTKVYWRIRRAAHSYPV